MIWRQNSISHLSASFMKWFKTDASAGSETTDIFFACCISPATSWTYLLNSSKLSLSIKPTITLICVCISCFSFLKFSVTIIIWLRCFNSSSAIISFLSFLCTINKMYNKLHTSIIWTKMKNLSGRPKGPLPSCLSIDVVGISKTRFRIMKESSSGLPYRLDRIFIFLLPNVNLHNPISNSFAKIVQVKFSTPNCINVWKETRKKNTYTKIMTNSEIQVKNQNTLQFITFLYLSPSKSVIVIKNIYKLKASPNILTNLLLICRNNRTCLIDDIRQYPSIANR